MAYSFDPRLQPGGPLFDGGRRRALRGVRRAGGLGRVLPGDDLENTRDHERIWLELQKRKQYADDNGGSDECCVPGGSGGPVSYNLSFEELITTLGATAWYRLGDGDTRLTTAATTGSDYVKDSCAGANHMNAVSDTGCVDFAVLADDISPVMSDGGTFFSYDQLQHYFTSVDLGVAFGGAGSEVPLRTDATSGRLSVCGFASGLGTAGTVATWSPLYRGQAFGCVGMVGGAVNTGWGVLFNHYYGYYELWLSGAQVAVFNGGFGNEYHFAVTDDGAGTVKWYINGILFKTLSGSMAHNTNGTFIGGGRIDFGATDGPAYFYGTVDEVSFFSDVTLTAAEIAQVMYASETGNETTSGPLFGSTAVVDASLPPSKLQPGTAGMVIRTDEDAVVEWGTPNVHTVSGSKTTAYTATAADDFIRVACSAAHITITLPPAADMTGRTFTVKKTDANAYNVVVDGDGSETIDTVTTYTLGSQWESVTVISDGTNWHVVTAYAGTPL